MTRSDSIFRASLWLWWRILGCQEWKHAGKPGDFVAEEEKDGGLDDSNGGDRWKERLWIPRRQRLQGPSLLASSDSTESNPPHITDKKTDLQSMRQSQDLWTEKHQSDVGSCFLLECITFYMIHMFHMCAFISFTSRQWRRNLLHEWLTQAGWRRTGFSSSRSFYSSLIDRISKHFLG